MNYSTILEIHPNLKNSISRVDLIAKVHSAVNWRKPFFASIYVYEMSGKEFDIR